jgi:hypothetical protein
MSLFKKRLTFASLMAVMIAALLPSPAFALTVDGVNPSSVVNDSNKTITITGTLFASGAVVSLNGYGSLPTTYVDATTLKAVVPEGIPSGQYTVTVTNADMSTNSLTNGLIIEDPAPPAATAIIPFTRPQILVSSSGASPEAIKSLKEFTFSVNFKNAGSVTALNTQVSFTSADLVPTNTGGVVGLGTLAGGANATASQTFISSTYLYGKTVVSIDATVTYYDDKGTAYSDKFTLSVPVSGASSGYGGSSVTSTPTGVRSGQLIIPSYGTTVDPLQPGTQFTLTMTLQNAGNDKAQRVTMIVGGGSSGTSGGTPQPGGVSGGSGEFTNFAPVGTSNIQSLGDLAAGEMKQVKQDLIVNVSTNPGAYPMKITFSYLNSSGETINDEQVITLLVFSLPNVEVNFYRPPDAFFQGQPGALPIQIINLGKRTSVLGTLKVTSKNGTVDGGETLVGALDAGGYFTLDATFTPDTVGETELDVVIEYTDDFNQNRVIERTLKVDVEEAFIEEATPDPSMPGGGGGEFVPVSDETFLQKTWRFILGLFGLDSAPPAPSVPDSEIPKEEFPVPVNPGGGGGGGKG